MWADRPDTSPQTNPPGCIDAQYSVCWDIAVPHRCEYVQRKQRGPCVWLACRPRGAVSPPMSYGQLPVRRFSIPGFQDRLVMCVHRSSSQATHATPPLCTRSCSVDPLAEELMTFVLCGCAGVWRSWPPVTPICCTTGSTQPGSKYAISSAYDRPHGMCSGECRSQPHDPKCSSCHVVVENGMNRVLVPFSTFRELFTCRCGRGRCSCCTTWRPLASSNGGADA
jgi:hypothetical protein